MTLMKLAPEIVRLRRVAKAYAAGEFSRLEYREARREVIDNFRPDVIGDDDTQPRTETAVNEVVRAARVAKRRKPRWPWLVAMAAAAVAAWLAVAQAQAASDIPRVSERNPNPATSPRLPVTTVRIGNFQPYPNVDEGELAAVIDAALTEVQGRNVEGGHGFTQPELEEIGRFLAALGVHRSGRLAPGDAAELGSLIAEQKQRRGVSVVELEEVAAAAQRYYRERGYFLAVVYVPSQRVADGVVELAVLPGVLGEVVVNGGDPELVAPRFADALGRPVTEAVMAERLYLLNQLPGLKAQAAFEPGSAVGETRLKLDVVQQRTWSALVQADNHGDEATGEQRLTVLASWLNPRGTGDVLNGALLQTVDPSNQTYGYLEYQTPVRGPYELRGRVANNTFSVAGGPGAEGEGLLADVMLRRSLGRRRTQSLMLEFGLRRHQLSWEDREDQVATFASARLDGHRIWDARRVAARARVFADVGRISGAPFPGQDDFFWNLGLDAHVWAPWDVPLLPGEQKVALRLTGQVSESQLPGTRRLSLGGAHRARGFERSTYLADAGAVLGLDLRQPLPLGELVVFADAAYGASRNELTPTWGHLASVGLGWDADLGANVVSRMSLSRPVSSKGTDGIAAGGAQFYWSVQYAY